jgi:hypothetical protein
MSSTKPNRSLLSYLALDHQSRLARKYRQSGSVFFKLPREIRDIIYDLVMGEMSDTKALSMDFCYLQLSAALDDVKLMATSRRLNEEFREAIYRKMVPHI